MKKLLLLLSITLAAISCTVIDPLNPPSHSLNFIIVENLSHLSSMEGVQIYRVKEGQHFYIFTDYGPEVEVKHDKDCNVEDHEINERLVRRREK